MPQFIDKKRIEELKTRPWAKLFPEKIKLLEQGKCTTCGNEITEFRNEISLKEYRISGMCQECQDSVFGTD